MTTEKMKFHKFCALTILKNGHVLVNTIDNNKYFQQSIIKRQISELRLFVETRI